MYGHRLLDGASGRHTMSEIEADGKIGISRRDIIKRGAIVGGTLVWAVPVVQSIGGTAFAASTQASQACNCVTFVCRTNQNGTHQIKTCTYSAENCGCFCNCGDVATFPCAAPDPCDVPTICSPFGPQLPGPCPPL